MNATANLPARPPYREAAEPPERRGIVRDGVRLLVTDRAGGTNRHAAFRDLPGILRNGDLLIVNDSATLPAALPARVPLHLSGRISDGLWVAEPRGAVSPGDVLVLPAGGSATMLAPLHRNAPRLWYVQLELPEPAEPYLHAHGAPIRYGHAAGSFPLADYQTIFARVPGSAEMPSAGRPFTRRALDALARRGVRTARVTLHCGVTSMEAHEPPPAEPFVVPPATARAVNAAKHEGRRVIAIGTTAVRAIESAVIEGQVTASSGWTDRIVSPQHGVAVVDGLLSGFHEPQASHIALLHAFVAPATLRRAYETAAAESYLWHEFGDVHLIV